MEKLQQLKTFEDACKVLGLDSEKVLPDFSSLPERDWSAMTAHVKLVIIARAANQLANDGKVWVPDWSKDDEYKYYPYFWMDVGSSGFRFHDYDYWYSGSSVGSRLAFISREVSDYVVETFVELYKAYFTL